MGIYVGMGIFSQNILSNEWENVCREAIDLANKLGLHDEILEEEEPWKEVTNRKFTDGTSGFYIRGRRNIQKDRVESIYIRNNLSYYQQIAGKKQQSIRPFPSEKEIEIPEDWNERRLIFEREGLVWKDELWDEWCRDNGYASVFHSKTLGRPIHITVLALVCLFADHFPYAVMPRGDITMKQCLEATELANRYLKQKINPPVICDGVRLLGMMHVPELKVPTRDRLLLFRELYLGPVSQPLRDTLLQEFPTELVEIYCQDKTSRSKRVFLHEEE